MMHRVRACDLPDDALLHAYAETSKGYADCFTTQTDKSVTLAAFVIAFYTTRLFKLERLILKIAVGKPSTDAQAAQLADASREDFAAWTLEDRSENQLLMCDFKGRTRSWFMVAPSSAEQGTRLFFGSGVVPIKSKRTGRSQLGWGFRLLLGFHKLYSRALLSSAVSRLEAT